MPVVPVKVVPEDLFSGKRYPSVIRAELSKQKANAVCIINWSDDEEIPGTITLSKNLLGDFVNEAQTYTISEFFSGQVYIGVHCGETISIGSIEHHAAILMKIMAKDKKDCVLHCNGHFSMGEEWIDWSFGWRTDMKSIICLILHRCIY